MVIRLRGQFDSKTQDALHDAFRWVQGSVKIDLSEAHLAAGALGEIVILAHRIGPKNVTVLNPTPMMRKILDLTQISNIIRVPQNNGGLQLLRKTA